MDDSDAPRESSWDLTPSTWKTALQILHDELKQEGSVSSYKLRVLFEQQLPEAERAHAAEIVKVLRYFDSEGPLPNGLTRPDFRWQGKGGSLHSEASIRKLVKQQEADAERAEETSAATVEEESPAERKKHRKEEARLGPYIRDALLDIYASEHLPNAAEFVFDVHSARAGGPFENVDLIAVHWRSSTSVELVAVEAKLAFGAAVVQQARNYTRFANRVWIAVPVSTEATRAATFLRAADASLFDHVVEMGLGILACRRRQGKAYEVFPVHWPRRLTVDPVEREQFIQRYRETFIKAKVVGARIDYPTLV